jgi:hypothetical protein
MITGPAPRRTDLATFRTKPVIVGVAPDWPNIGAEQISSRAWARHHRQ